MTSNPIRRELEGREQFQLQLRRSCVVLSCLLEALLKPPTTTDGGPTGPDI